MRRTELALLLLTAAAWTAWSQPLAGNPRVGYVYPAGGMQGSIVAVTAGGQQLRGAKTVLVSGDGVRATVMQWYRPVRNVNAEQRQEITRRLKARRDELLGKKPSQAPNPDIELPAHPWLDRLGTMTLRELEHVQHGLQNVRKRQPNMQIAELLQIEVSVDASASPGPRELRVVTAAGLTNPVRFEVGTLPEVCELEPNDPVHGFQPPKDPAVDLPVVFNGQAMPGDVDRFSFHAASGQRLVIQAHARELTPYLADAVPGWFQATLSLYDARGRRVAYADDYEFHPDPVLLFDVPDDGVYTVSMQDAVYRGREDFVYRIEVSERPFITRAFPLGGSAGVATRTSIAGVNLLEPRIALDTGAQDQVVREAVLETQEGISNTVNYEVSPLPSTTEAEPNDEPTQAQAIVLPQIVDGRIQVPGDVDSYQFDAKAGDEIVVEAMARRLNSPLDSLARLVDESGEVLAWNDDCEDTGSGLLTHQADSYFRAAISQDGSYQVLLSDAQGHGGEEYAYRLRVSSPRPDFAVKVTPSSINIPAGRSAAVDVYVLRKDGFDGPVQLSLKGTLVGVVLDSGSVPAGADHVRTTVSALHQMEAPFVLSFEATATIDGQPVVHQALPAEDMMQAFAYHHLAPAEEFIAMTVGKSSGATIRLAIEKPVPIAPGQRVEIPVHVPKTPMLKDVQLALASAPDGISLHDVAMVQNCLTFVLSAEGDTLKPGSEGNVIVEAFAEVAPRNKQGKATAQKRRVSLGVLPAIPIVITGR